MLLETRDLKKRYGAAEVLARVDVRIEDDDRIGLVGPNGAGKTTLIRLLLGQEEPTDGQVERRRGLRIGYLPQKPPDLGNLTLWEAMLDAVSELRALEDELHRLGEDLGDAAKHDEALKRYSEVQHEFEARGGYGYEVRIKQVLSGLAFGAERWRQPLAQFSGGEKTRACLARLLIQEPDLLILDEPTNHLDLASVEWLETWLDGFRHALLVVSHDRWFLDKVTRRTWELSFGALEAYRGNYTHYVRQREERFAEREAQWTSQQAYIERTQEFIRRNIAGQRTKEAQGRRAHLEKFLEREAIARPRKPPALRIRMGTDKATGEMVVQTRNLRAGYTKEKVIVEAGDLELARGQRVALVGPNGAGKTTMLKTLMGALPPLTGKVRTGAGVAIGYLSQAQDELDPDNNVLGTLKALKPDLPDEPARTFLGGFLFTGDDVFKPVRALSGGERSRLALARIALLGANVLFLDEPTNHLDIQAREELQAALLNFEGTQVLVSHDRYLVQNLATHVWIVDRGALKALIGKWETYLAWREGREAPPPKPKAEPMLAERAETKEQARLERELERQARREEQQLKRTAQKAHARQKDLEPKIEALERKLSELNEAITQAGQAQERERVMQLGYEYQQAEAELKALYEEWTHWGELAEARSEK